MRIDGIPATVYRLQTEIAKKFDVDVVTAHPHEAASKSDEDMYRFMICCEFPDGVVYMADASAIKCANKSYIDQWIKRMRVNLGTHS